MRKIWARIGACLALVAATSPAHADNIPSLRSAMFHFPLRGADLASTEYVLETRHGVREQNPLGQTREMRVVLALAASAGTSWLDHKLERKKKAQWALRIGHILWTGWLVQHNLNHGRKK
jgi:hypothetical protein